MLIGDDFFSVDFSELGRIDIMVSNIPYNLSSKVIYWLGGMNIPALICVQKEFAEHMTAKPGTRNYSKLSVVSSLRFRVHHVRDVPAGNFYPKPRVDSSLVYLVPKADPVTESEEAAISLLMNHKKKRLANAVIDSASALGIQKAEARTISAEIAHRDSRTFKLPPEQILAAARQLNSLVDALKRNR
jgi:16S rRNA (adenine1518-N6/adenine1519-N6)-dimethyltransferase